MKNYRESLKTQIGFTLVELIIAIAILLVIIEIIYGGFAKSMKLKRDTEDRIDVFQSGKLAIDRMVRELSMAVILPFNPKSTFIGKGRFEGEVYKYSISFTSLAGSAYPEEKIQSDQEEIIYSFIKEGDRKGVLLRSSNKYPGIGEQKSLDEIEILTGMEEFIIRYFDGISWYEEWNYEIKKQFPKAVEIKLIVSGEKEIRYGFSSIALLPLSKLVKVQ